MPPDILKKQEQFIRTIIGNPPFARLVRTLKWTLLLLRNNGWADYPLLATTSSTETQNDQGQSVTTNTTHDLTTRPIMRI